MTLLGADQLGNALDRLLAAAAPTRSVVGWATVELDRAEIELAPADRDPAQAASRRPPPDGEDSLLGARARSIGDVVLLEPATEGPLAAALARHGEGPIALYVLAEPGAVDRVRSAGFQLSTTARGPLGPERRVLLGPRDGPFVLLVTP